MACINRCWRNFFNSQEFENIITTIVGEDGGSAEIVVYDETSVSCPPTTAEITAIFGTPAVVSEHFIGIINSGGTGENVYICFTDGVSQWFFVNSELAFTPTYETYMQYLNPLAWWRFQETAGLVAANSGYGENLDGVISGTTTLGQAGLLGANEAYEFDGLTSQINVVNNNGMDQLPITYFMLIYPHSAGEDSGGRLFSFGDAYNIRFLGNNLRLFAPFSGTNSTFATDNSTISFNDWSAVFLQIFDNTAKIYFGINGVLTEATFSLITYGIGYFEPLETDFEIGNLNAATRTFDGLYDELAVFKRLLTVCEMQKIVDLTGV